MSENIQIQQQISPQAINQMFVYEKSKKYNQLFTSYRTRYYIPQNKDVSCNCDLYNILLSESSLFCLVEKGAVFINKKTRSITLTSIELYWHLDMLVFLMHQKFLPYTKYPKEKYIQNLLQHLFPVEYINLVIKPKTDPILIKTFQSLIPIIPDPRIKNLSQYQQNNFEKERLIRRLNNQKHNFPKELVSIGERYIAQQLSKINAHFQQAIQLEYNILNSHKNIKKHAIKTLTYLKYLKANSDEESVVLYCVQCIDCIQARIRLDVFEPDADIDDIIKKNNFIDNISVIFKKYTQMIQSDQWIDSFDDLNTLYEYGLDQQLNYKDLLYRLAQIRNEEFNEEFLRGFVNHVQWRSELIHEFLLNVSKHQQALVDIALNVFTRIYYWSILTGVNQLEVEYMIVDSITCDDIMQMINFYVLCFLERNKNQMNIVTIGCYYWIYLQSYDLIYLLVRQNKDIDTLLFIEQTFCEKKNNKSIVNSIIGQVEKLFKGDSVELQYLQIRDQISCQLLTLFFQSLLLHYSHGNYMEYLKNIHLQCYREKRAYDALNKTNSTTNFNQTLLAPSKSCIKYFGRQGLQQEYINIYLQLNSIFFSLTDDPKSMDYMRILIIAFGNAHRWQAFVTFQHINNFLQLLKNPKHKDIILWEFIQKIISEDWSEQYTRRFQKNIPWEKKEIVYSGDLLSYDKIQCKIYGMSLQDIKTMCFLFQTNILPRLQSLSMCAKTFHNLSEQSKLYVQSNFSQEEKDQIDKIFQKLPEDVDHDGNESSSDHLDEEIKAQYTNDDIWKQLDIHKNEFVQIQGSILQQHQTLTQIWSNIQIYRSIGDIQNQNDMYERIKAELATYNTLFNHANYTIDVINEFLDKLGEQKHDYIIRDAFMQMLRAEFGL